MGQGGGCGSPQTTELCCPQPPSLQHSPVHSPHGMGGLVCPRHAPCSSLLFLRLRLNTPGSSLPHQTGRSHSSFPPAPCPPWGQAQVSRTLRTVGFFPTSIFGVTRGATGPAASGGEGLLPKMQPREACPPWGRISCQGPEDLTGKGPAVAKSGLSLHPQGKGSGTKAGSQTPGAPGHCPEWPS